ncbi:energy-coupling factor transporter transmembrane component T [Dysosmobacter sp.]|uniref:energy-coupling factor transporter transmembrane component T n=1 Tax=Dysosmobacter sp. TaxID=2591382 RepID=UPI002D7EB5EB|nr:energy-coupling factor transporter transmembrane component T [Dysosmobacter sp.]
MNLLYFILVITCTMFLLHPVSLCVSLAGAIAYAACLKGGKALLHSLGYLLPVTLLAAVLNPVFSHEGATVLAYLPSGNPLTLESVAYGAAAAVMLAAILLWFTCLSAVLTPDKLIFLFGRILPALSLLLSMTLRFVPRFLRQFREVAEAQRGLGRDVSKGPLPQRLRTAVTILSIVVTWALESSVETADSMKSRGYGLPGRTAFALYRWESRDTQALCWLAAWSIFLAAGAAAGGLRWRYYPTIRGGGTWPGMVCQAAYLLLSMTPVLLNWKEGRQWRQSGCKM